MSLRGNQSTTSLQTKREWNCLFENWDFDAYTRWKNGESAENIQNYKGKFTKLLFASVLSKSLFLRVIRL
jgi:hypothetical protein